jgi:hypothetical protein
LQDTAGALRDTVVPDRQRFRIRTRLALLVLALALPFAGYSAFSAVEEARLERAHAAARMFGIAQITAARLDDHINDIRSVLQVLSAFVTQTPPGPPTTTPSCAA